MRFGSVTFHFDKGHYPMCRVGALWPELPEDLVILLGEDDYHDITLFINGEEALIGFKNRVLWACEAQLKRIRKHRDLKEEHNG